MRVYILGCSDGPHLEPIDKPAGDEVSRLLWDRELNPASWKSPALKPRNSRAFKQRDSTSILSHVSFKVFSERVRSYLTTELGITHDWYDLDVEGVDVNYSLLDVRHTIDAVDEEKSTLKWLRPGRLSGIEVYVFKPDMLQSQWLFRVKTRNFNVYCTDQFVELIKEQGWRGFAAAPVWDSEIEPWPHHPYRKQIAERPDIFGPDGICTGYEDAWPDEWKSS